MKRIPLIIAVWVVFGLSLIGQDNRINLAYQYFRDQDWQKAAPIFKDLYEKNQAPHYLQYYIRCLIETGQSEEAIRELKKAQRETRDLSLNIEIGYVYEEMGNLDEAARYYEMPFRNLPANSMVIRNLGNTYMSYLKYEYAQNLYTIGRTLLGQPDEFRMEMGNLFASQRRYPEMLEEYFNMLITDPGYSATLQHILTNAARTDIDGDLMSLIKEKVYQYIQMVPGLPVFSEMLVWVLTQEGNFPEAVNQVIALDKRLTEQGERVLTVARKAREAYAYEASMKAYRYIISKNNEPAPPTANNIQLNSASLFKTATIEFFLTQKDFYAANPDTPIEQLIQLQMDMIGFLDQAANDPATAQLIIPLARLQYQQLREYEAAIATLDRGLQVQGMPRSVYTLLLLEKGDIMLASGDPWEALFIYARVEKENPDNAEGSEARMKKARLSYLTGNHQWALTQLEVLKGSTSRLVANDALELALFIRENLNAEDSSDSMLEKTAQIDYLIFRHAWDEALLSLDSLLASSSGHALTDDWLFRKASILAEYQRFEEAASLLSMIISQYASEFLAPKALYQLGLWYQGPLNDQKKAVGYFQEILRSHPTSFYFEDARIRLKELRSPQSDQPETRP